MLQDSYKQIEAYIDGELNATEQRQIVYKINNSKELQNYYHKIKMQKEMLIQWWNTKKKH